MLRSPISPSQTIKGTGPSPPTAHWEAPALETGRVHGVMQPEQVLEMRASLI